MDEANKIIGKVSATGNNPSTINDFYFWTHADVRLSPFDVVKVEHFENSVTYGVVSEINHVTDSASHFASYISSDFGNLSEHTKGNTDRLRFNYVKARVIGNTQNIYTPVLHDSLVRFCSPEDIKDALGLSKPKNPLTCGYLEMYGERVPVQLNANFLVGPDGAHLNISGISGLACKTSYCMFLMNALQQKYEMMDEDDSNKKSIAYVIFNVKGKDLLSIDEDRVYSDEKEKAKDAEKYKLLGIEQRPFNNVQYFYPYSAKPEQHHIQSYAGWEDMASKQLNSNRGYIFKYPFIECKDKLEMLFANEEDTTSTMETIVSYIKAEKGPFSNIKSWKGLTDALDSMLSDQWENERKNSGIATNSWRKFKRLLTMKLMNKIFSDTPSEECHEVDLNTKIQGIKNAQVLVVDIARLDDGAQGFVFGDIISTLNKLMSAKDDPETPDKIVVFVDELNKYASSDTPKDSPILKELLDITERGRSLGLILFAVEQFRSVIHKRVKGNCSTSAYGRTNFVELASSDYSYFGDVYKNLMTRLSAGEYIVQNPALRSLIKINFPRPAYKENS